MIRQFQDIDRIPWLAVFFCSLIPFLSFGQASQPVFPASLKFKFDLVTMASTQSAGTEFELHFKEEIAILSGAYISFPGYTFKLGIRFYPSNENYLELTGFYRLRKYYDRYYEWRTDHQLSPYAETITLGIGGSERDNTYHLVADEIKQVIGCHVIFGKQSKGVHNIIIDRFFGVGFRYKYRVLEESKFSVTGVNSSLFVPNPVYYDPPKVTIIKDFLFSLQAGFSIGFGVKLKRKIREQEYLPKPD